MGEQLGINIRLVKSLYEVVLGQFKLYSAKHATYRLRVLYKCSRVIAIKSTRLSGHFQGLSESLSFN